jgi:hypothetical protein
MPNFGGSRPGYWFKRPPRTKTGKVLIVREEVGPSLGGTVASPPIATYLPEDSLGPTNMSSLRSFGNSWFSYTRRSSSTTAMLPRSNGQVIQDKKIFFAPRVFQDATVTETGTRIELTGRPWEEALLKISSQLDDTTPFISSRDYYQSLRNDSTTSKVFDLNSNWGNHPPNFGVNYVDGQNYRPQAQIVSSNRTSAQLKYAFQSGVWYAIFDTVGGIRHWGVDLGQNNDECWSDRYAQITTMKEIAAFLQKAEEQLGFQVTVVKSYEYLYANYTAVDLEQFDHIWDIVHGGLANYRDLGVGHNADFYLMTPKGLSGTVYYPIGSKYGEDGYFQYSGEGVPGVIDQHKYHPFVKAQRPLTAIIPPEIKTLYKSYLQSGGNVGFLNSPYDPEYLYAANGGSPRLGWHRITGINDFINELGGGNVERYPAQHHMNKRSDTVTGDKAGAESYGGKGIWSPFGWNQAFKNGDLTNAARETTGGFVNNKYFPSPKWYLNSEFFIDNSKREVDLQSVSSWSYKDGKLNIGTGTPVIVGKMEPTDEVITSLNAKNFNYCCAALWKRGSLSEAPQGSVFVINNLHWVVDVDLKYSTDYNSLWTTTQKDPQVHYLIVNGRRTEFRWVQNALQKIVDPIYRKFAVWGSRKRDEENFLNLLQIFEKS